MITLLILGCSLLALWTWGIVARDGRARFMQDWVHVLLLAAAIIFLMLVVAIITNAIRG